MGAEVLRRGASAARAEWADEESGTFKHAARIHLAVARWLDQTATSMDENTVLDAPDPGEYMPPNPEALWCDLCGGAVESPNYTEGVCHDWDEALTVARAYLGESS